MSSNAAMVVHSNILELDQGRRELIPSPSETKETAMSMHTNPDHLTVNGGSGVMFGCVVYVSWTHQSSQPPEILFFTEALTEE